MFLYDLPPEILQIIIKYLPGDVVLCLIQSNSWITPIAFRSYYRRIIVTDEPHQFNKSTSYGGVKRPQPRSYHAFDYPSYDQMLHSDNTGVFRSVYSLVRFFKRYPDFVPDEVKFCDIMSIIPSSYEFQGLITKVPKLHIIELVSGDNPAIFEIIEILNKFRNNIYSEFCYQNAVPNNMPSNIRHVNIPEAIISDYDEFLISHPNLRTLVTKDFLKCNMDLCPPTLKYVGSGTIEGLSKIVLPSSATHFKLSGNVSESFDLSQCHNLQHFESLESYEPWKGEITMPVHLQSLKLSDIMHHSDISKLYRGGNFLTRLELSGTFGVKFYHSLFYSFKLPPTLKELYVTNMFINLRPFEYQDCLLPHPLLSGEYTFRIDNNFKLPAGLEILYLDCPSIAIDSSWRIPDSVRELVLSRVIYFVNFASLIMPISLKSLFIESIYGLSFDSYVESNICYFPENLESFTYYGKPIHNLQTNLLELPNLTYLQLSSPGLEGFNEPFLVNGMPIGHADFQHLQSLRTLELNAIPILGDINMKLPNSLRRFRCAMSEVKGFADTFQFPLQLQELILEQASINLNVLNELPSSLEHLELLNCEAIMPTELSMCTPHLRVLIMNRSGIDQQTFELLNLKNYSKLEIAGFQNNNISKIDLSIFPPSVTNLSVYKNKAIIICGSNVNLPNLRNLELSENFVQKHYDEMNQKGKEEQFIIPEEIECLKMRDCEINSIDFIVWPQELGSLNLETNKISVAELISLCKRYSKVNSFAGIGMSRELFNEIPRELQRYAQNGTLWWF